MDIPVEIGPVDYLVVELPPGPPQFTDEMRRELAALVEAELIQVIGFLVVRRDADGRLHEVPVTALDERDRRLGVDPSAAGRVLPGRSVRDLTDSVRPGTCAAVVVWANTWATPFAEASRRAGGRIRRTGSLPSEDVSTILVQPPS